MKTDLDLRKLLKSIDGKGYKAYKDIKGTYIFHDWTLSIDYVQGDPFASPSRIRVILPHKVTGIKKDMVDSSLRRRGLSDLLAREVAKGIKKEYQRGSGSGKSGILSIDEPGQEILDRTAVKIHQEKIEIRLEVGLPAAGRRVLGQQAIKIFCEKLSNLFPKVVNIQTIGQKKVMSAIHLVEDQCAIRQYLQKNNLVAFVANGAILPRISGVSQRPMREKAVAFKSPSSMEVAIETPYSGTIMGMGIKAGVTLIVGGGYHGKSTLLEALERGVYDHVLGDGREYCITNEDAMKIRAEDGRSIKAVDISPFITNLPNKINTKTFSTENASGSTSQAANIMEALEMESHLLLIDEDTSATNFMIRDIRMQKLVHANKEPITPFIDRVRQLYEDQKVSSIIVIGGSGDYFDVADQVIMMEDYEPRDVTDKAKDIAKEFKAQRQVKEDPFKELDVKRHIMNKSFKETGKKPTKVKANGLRSVVYNRQEIDLSGVEQLVDASQTRTIAALLLYLEDHKGITAKTFNETLHHLDQLMKEDGLESISHLKGHPGNLAYVRKQEVGAALNRWRCLVMKVDNSYAKEGSSLAVIELRLDT